MTGERSPGEGQWWRRDTALVAGVAIAVHARTTLFGFTGLDDVDLIVDDREFLARRGSVLAAFGRAYMHAVDPAHAYYRPVVTASFALDAAWSGVRPSGYHATNVLLHALACALFMALLRRFSVGRGVTLAAGLAFAVHPSLASSVAWIPGRNDSLLAIFALGAWLLFLRDARRPSLATRGLQVACFAFALATKETAVVLPVLLLLHVALLEPDAWRWLSRPETGGVYLAGWGLALVAFVQLHPAVAAPSPRDVMEGVPRAATALGRVVFPFDPVVLAAAEDAPVVPGWLAASGLAAASWLVPGVRPRVVAVGAAAFVLFLAPVLAVPGTLVLDNRLYLPACGAIIAIAELARAALAATRGDGRLAAAFAGAGILALAGLTLAFEGSFRDRRTFARQAVVDSPRSALAHFCLGESFQIDGDPRRALTEYEAALAIGPAEVVHNNIAVIHMANEDWPGAERELRSELAINPRYARAYSNLAIVLRHEGRLDESVAARARADALAAP